MIKAEVVFMENGDDIFIGNHLIKFDSYVSGNPAIGHDSVNIYRVRLIEGDWSSERIFKTLGEAMIYCMERSK